MGEMLAITLKLASAESGFFKPWAAAFLQESGFLQEDLGMVATGKETSEKPDQYVLVAALSGALAWEHPSEKSSEPRTFAPREFVYPMEVAEFMEIIETGRQHTLPEEFEQI
jgi:hypothetical protein